LGGGFGHGCFLFELKGRTFTEFVHGCLGGSRVDCLPWPLRPGDSIVLRGRRGCTGREVGVGP
jgi:hypothetical protein